MSPQYWVATYVELELAWRLLHKFPTGRYSCPFLTIIPSFLLGVSDH